MAIKKDSKTKRRLAVVKDVIAQLRAKAYLTGGNFGYVKLPGKHNKARPNGQLKTFLNNTTEACGICAKGGLFLSLVRKENEFKNCDSLSLDSITNRLTTDALFERENLNLIEAYYENYKIYEYTTSCGLSVVCFDVCSDCSDTWVESEFSKKKAAEFAKYHNQKMSEYTYDRTERLLTILKNMVENGGIFKP